MNRDDRLLAQRVRELHVVAQPIFDLSTDTVAGVEMLSRFRPRDGSTPPAPDEVFAQAHDRGFGVELELAAITAISLTLGHRPLPGFVSVNVSARTLVDERCPELLESLAERPLVVELTEQTPMDPAALQHPLRRLREHGVRLALDDIGTAYSALRLLLLLRPEIVKLDRSILAGIDGDVARQALARAARGFADDTGTEVIAEGVQTGAELNAVHATGIPWVQGFFLHEPVALDLLATP